jgi:hypothetical protein
VLSFHHFDLGLHVLASIARRLTAERYGFASRLLGDAVDSYAEPHAGADVDDFSCHMTP